MNLIMLAGSELRTKGALEYYILSFYIGSMDGSYIQVDRLLAKSSICNCDDKLSPTFITVASDVILIIIRWEN